MCHLATLGQKAVHDVALLLSVGLDPLRAGVMATQLASYQWADRMHDCSQRSETKGPIPVAARLACARLVRC